MNRSSRLFIALLVAATWLPISQAHAGFFEDDEARRSILDLRAKVKEIENSKLDKSSVVDLTNQDDVLREEIAKLRGQIEVLTNQVKTLEERQKDFYLDLDMRLKKLEPREESASVKDLNTDNNENQVYAVAEDKFKTGDYKGAVVAYNAFLKQFPQSNLIASAQYQLGNAYYLQGDYKNALKQQSAIVKRYPRNQITPDAMLNMASCQIGLNDIANAKKTLSSLVKKYPKSGAAKKAKERLAQL